MRLRWTKAARGDRELIYAYVEAGSPDAALRLDDRFEERANQLTHFPTLAARAALRAHVNYQSRKAVAYWSIG